MNVYKVKLIIILQYKSAVKISYKTFLKKAAIAHIDQYIMGT